VTVIASKPNHDDVSQPANDNHTRDPNEFSILDLIEWDDGADLAKQQAERLANAVVIVMAACLIFGPLVYFALYWT